MRVVRSETTADEDALWLETIHGFGARRIVPHNAELDRHPHDRELVRGLLRELGGLGFNGAVIAPEYGGTGAGSLALHAGLDALSFYNAGLAMSAMPSYVTARALSRHGSDDQKDRWLGPIADGDAICAWAVTEPDAGSDVASITSRAVPDNGGWRLDGRKMFITNASIADAFLLLVRTGARDGRGEMSLFVVPADLPGIAVAKELDKMGLRSSPTCEVSFDGVEVADADRLGEVGAGWRIGMDLLGYERIAATAICAGVTHRALELSRDYAETRSAFGGPIADIGAVAGMLADMAASLLQLRLLYQHICALVDAERPAALEGSAAKLVSARLAKEAVDLGVQIHGGYGYIREYEIERLYRDVRLFSIGGGTSEIQRKIVAAQLRKQTDWPRKAGSRP